MDGQPSILLPLVSSKSSFLDKHTQLVIDEPVKGAREILLHQEVLGYCNVVTF